MQTATLELVEPIQRPETKKRPKTRCGNGEGTFYQRPNGRWEATMTVGYNAQGKRIRRTIYGNTKKEAQDELTKLQTGKMNGMLCQNSRESVAGFLTRWLEDVARPGIRDTTHANYKRAIDNHIGPLIGGTLLAKLGPQSQAQRLKSAYTKSRPGFKA